MIPLHEESDTNAPQLRLGDKQRTAIRRFDLIVHAGDSVVVTERNRIVDVQLQGVALNSAATGEQLRVGLKIGHSTVTAVVVAPGRARLVTTAVEVHR